MLVRPAALYGKSGARFSPLDSSDLVLWLSAAIDGSMTLSSGDLTAWTDQAGTANNGAPPASGQRPTLTSNQIGGRQALVYSQLAGDNVVVNAESSINNIWDGGGYAIAVFRATNPGGGDNARIFEKGTWTLTYNSTVGGQSNLSFTQTFSGTDGTWNSTSKVIVHNTNYIMEIGYNSDSTGNAPSMLLNNAAVAIGSSSPTLTRDSDSASNLGIGGQSTGGASRSLEGAFAEAMLFSATPSASYLTELRRYFASYYGITLS